MKTLTPQQIVALGPCEGYDLEQVTELFDNKKSVTYLEILNTDKIPLEDIIWVFCQLTVLDDNIREQWTEIIVTRTVKNHALHCGIDTVEQWARNWLSGDDRTYKAASDAAGYAAHAAACYVTHAAAYAANVAAVYFAADAAYIAEAAADAAARAISAATYAAYATSDAYITALKIERKQQIQDLKDILQGESK